MSDFVQDLWHDLLEKRLWPVALALLLCVAAVPVVLAKSAVEPPPPEPVAASPSKASDLDIEVVDESGGGGKGSSLDNFASKNPFKPPARVTDSGSSAETSSTTSSPGSENGRGDQPGSPGSSPPGGGEPVAPPAPAAPPKTAQYEYVADVTFWNGNRRRKVLGMRKLDMLPSESAPLLIFMGVTASGSNAVFLVDSTMRAAGEGRCKPSRSNCAFVYIGPGSEHTFTNEKGESYTIRIDEIRRAKRDRARDSSKSPTADAALGDHSEPRRFSVPFLSDLVEVTSPGNDPSSDSAEGR